MVLIHKCEVNLSGGICVCICVDVVMGVCVCVSVSVVLGVFVYAWVFVCGVGYLRMPGWVFVYVYVSVWWFVYVSVCGGWWVFVYAWVGGDVRVCNLACCLQLADKPLTQLLIILNSDLKMVCWNLSSANVSLLLVLSPTLAKPHKHKGVAACAFPAYLHTQASQPLSLFPL